MTVAAIRPRPWTREEYERLVASGLFHEDERLELIEGEILERTPQNPRHAAIVALVHRALGDVLVLAQQDLRKEGRTAFFGLLAG